MVRRWQGLVKVVETNNGVASRHVARLTLDPNDVHAQCLSTDSQAPTDVAKPDYQQGLTGEFPFRRGDFACNGPPLTLGTNEDVEPR